MASTNNDDNVVRRDTQLDAQPTSTVNQSTEQTQRTPQETLNATTSSTSPPRLPELAAAEGPGEGDRRRREAISRNNSIAYQNLSSNAAPQGDGPHPFLGPASIPTHSPVPLPSRNLSISLGPGDNRRSYPAVNDPIHSVRPGGSLGINLDDADEAELNRRQSRAASGPVPRPILVPENFRANGGDGGGGDDQRLSAISYAAPPGPPVSQTNSSNLLCCRLSNGDDILNRD